MPGNARSVGIALPHRIARVDARSAIERVERTLRNNPAAQFMIAAVAVNSASCDIDAAGVDFTPLHWVALADTCLEWAAKRLAAGGHLDQLKLVESARAALDLENRQDA